MDWVGYIIWCSLCVLGDVWVGVTQAKDVDFSNQIWLSSSSSTQLSIIYNHTADSNPIIINHNHNHNKSIEQLGLPVCNLHTHPTTPNQIYKPTTLKQTLKYSKRSQWDPQERNETHRNTAIEGAYKLAPDIPSLTHNVGVIARWLYYARLIHLH